jgi:hypothetical protein
MLLASSITAHCSYKYKPGITLKPGN